MILADLIRLLQIINHNLELFGNFGSDPAHVRQNLFGGHAGQKPYIHREFAKVGHNIYFVAAFDHADIYRRRPQ